MIIIIKIKNKIILNRITNKNLIKSNKIYKVMIIKMHIKKVK